MATLPVGDVIGAAFRRVLNHPQQAFSVGLPYFLLLVGLGVLSALLLPADPAAFSGSDLMLALIVLIAQLLVYTAMVVAWHRVTLLGYAADSGFFRVGMGRRELKFLGYSLLLYLAAALVGVAAGIGGVLSPALGIVLGIAALGGAVFVFLRCSLVFPATAADHPTSLGVSWRQTQGHFWAMFAILLVIALAVFVAVLVIYLALGFVLGWLGMVGQILLTIALVPIQLLAGFIGVSALSYIYRVLSNHPDPLAETP